MAFGGSIKTYIFFAFVFCFVAESQQKYLSQNFTKTLSNFKNKLPKFVAPESNSLSISNGTNSTEGQFPYFALIVMNSDDGESWACAGALIKSKFVITTAYCLDDDVDEVFVFLGVFSAESEPMPYLVRQFAYHPQYNHATQVYNIAIIELAEAVKSSTTIKPIALATQPLPCGTLPTMIGGGEINDYGEGPEVLQHATVSVMTFSSCTRYYMFDVDQHFCVQSPNYYPVRRGCEGDEGDPIVLNNKLYGLVLFTEASTCTEDYPNLVVSIDFVAPWIKEMMKKAPKGW